MPRIDPRRLLECLGVLLTQNGGIRSKEEVQRLASLMMKFSKKLVSKCVYILILKNTETELLGLFMSAGGWTLVLTWLNDGIFGKNWALVTELLELLLMCPVDVERLKSNSIPRLVKGLSKDESLGKVNLLATRLVEQWLKIVKDETVAPDREVTSTVVIVKQDDMVVDTPMEMSAAPEATEEVTVKNEPFVNNNGEQAASALTATPVASQPLTSSQIVMAPQSFYKLTVRDGKQIIAKVDGVSANSNNSALVKLENTEVTACGEEMTVLAEQALTSQASTETAAVIDTGSEVVREKKEGSSSSSGEKKSSSSSKDRSKHDRSKHRSSSSSKSSSSSSRDKSGYSSSSSNSNRDKSSSSSSSRDKDKHRDRTRDKDKYKHRSNGSVKHSNSNSSSNSSSSSSSNKESSKENKEKQAEKDKDTLAKIQPKSVEKLGRIPKKSSSSSSGGEEKSKSEKSEHRTKPSISIEVRKKDSGDRPKTVKVFNSKLRSTGLEEAAKPPPSRLAVKKPTVAPPPVLPTKRPSPSREAPPPPEKRIKLPDTETERQDKPGGIKLIPPKPKPAFLQESDMFMDALAASATNKKEPKKRKRRSSVSKDTNNSGNTSPPASPSVTNTPPSPLSSPMALKGITAPKFYKDTLETDEPKASETEDDKQDNGDRTPEQDNSEDPMDEGPTENVVKEVDGIRGVLVYHKRRGPKKSVKWRTDTELEEVQYFELDETERVNVTKTFMDMKQMEHTGEREALQLSRKLPNEDLMDERTPWKVLIPIDLKPALAEWGKKSLEKDIQFAREKVILQALYFNRSMLPDSPAEPDPETHQMKDPTTIPLDDVTGNPDSVNDYQNTPWPEPKGSPPHVSPMPGGPPMFGGMPPFNPPMGPPGFHGMPQPFGGPNFMPPPNMMGGGDWRAMQGDGSNMPPPDVNHGVGAAGGPMNPNMFNNRPDGGFNNAMGMDENNTGFPPQGFGPGPGPMPGPPGPGPMYPNFPQNNRGNNRGGFRNMGRGGWFRPSGPPPGWHAGNRGGGGNHWGGRGGVGGGVGGGGGICKQFKMQGFCRQRDTCPFMHPQTNNAPY